jgi:predicted nucleotidyltransferase
VLIVVEAIPDVYNRAATVAAAEVCSVHFFVIPGVFVVQIRS